MGQESKKGLRRATVIFWILFLYIIAALIWWFLSLEQQNRSIHQLRKDRLTVTSQNNAAYNKEVAKIEKSRRRETFKYATEGLTFLLLIVFGAAYIYRLVRRQFKLQLQQQNFVMAVTHELKTPISVARLNLETMQKHKLEESKQKKLLQMTLQETMRLDTLINNILISSQLDGDVYKTSKEELNFSDLLADVIQQFQNRYAEKKIISEIAPEVELRGDPLLLKMLVSNLLENANKYAEKQTSVICRLQKNDRKVQLQIIDEGVGIADEEKKKVFEKFYRSGNEQTRKTQGTGLGLFICKKIAHSHRANITIADNEQGGSNFTVTFNTK
ncbi:MAG: HAMP domain-containing histidine kinase [Bacteroidota bacterium]|nr:HAMP domain-containing histidine kinase [Bacteroidota bacterium]